MIAQEAYPAFGLLDQNLKDTAALYPGTGARPPAPIAQWYKKMNAVLSGARKNWDSLVKAKEDLGKPKDALEAGDAEYRKQKADLSQLRSKISTKQPSKEESSKIAEMQNFIWRYEGQAKDREKTESAVKRYQEKLALFLGNIRPKPNNN